MKRFALIMTTVVQPKAQRIQVRASAQERRLLQEAARESHKSLGEFVLEAGIIAAHHALADRVRFELSPKQWQAFQAGLNRSVRDKPKLKTLLSERS